jgi:hypothetical protein
VFVRFPVVMSIGTNNRVLATVSHAVPAFHDGRSSVLLSDVLFIISSSNYRACAEHNRTSRLCMRRI